MGYEKIKNDKAKYNDCNGPAPPKEKTVNHYFLTYNTLSIISYP